MNFKLNTSGSFYCEKEANKLKKLGFKFENDSIFSGGDYYKLPDPVYIDIFSLDDLIEFSKKYGDLVITTDSIEIYDDYRE